VRYDKSKKRLTLLVIM